MLTFINDEKLMPELIVFMKEQYNIDLKQVKGDKHEK